MLTPGDRNVNRVAPSELWERSLSRGKAGAHRPEREAAGSADIIAERREGEQRHPEPIPPGLKCLPLRPRNVKSRLTAQPLKTLRGCQSRLGMNYLECVNKYRCLSPTRNQLDQNLWLSIRWEEADREWPRTGLSSSCVLSAILRCVPRTPPPPAPSPALPPPPSFWPLRAPWLPGLPAPRPAFH